jgi:hypothetical protein
MPRATRAGSGIPLVAGSRSTGRRGISGVTNTSYVGKRRGRLDADVTRAKPTRLARKK